LTERALRVSYGIVIPRVTKRELSNGYGSGPLSTDRSWEFYVAIADEIGEWVQRVLADRAPDDSLRRIERDHQEEAAGELVTFVRGMTASVRIVVETRSGGMSWRALTRSLPDRAYFSIVDD